MFELSSYEFSTYRTRKRTISIRHRSYILVHSTIGYHFTTYMPFQSAYLTLPNGSEIEMDEMSIGVGTSFEYDGKIMVHSFRMGTITNRKSIEEGLGKIRIVYSVALAADKSDIIFEHPAIIKPLPLYQSTK